jgi:hypothetical protein
LLKITGEKWILDQKYFGDFESGKRQR